MQKKAIKFIDLFAGIGGIRLGFEQACKTLNYKPECVYTSEIKKSALSALEENFKHKVLDGDIHNRVASELPNFDFLLAGFPCQAFSVAGKQRGFLDTRGTLFFEVERILKEKRPYGFLLENVEGLVTHDREFSDEKIGRTLKTILHSLKELDYKVTWKVLNGQDFGVAQNRKRIYIVGTKNNEISLMDFPVKKAVFGDIMEQGLPCVDNEFTRKIFDIFTIEQLYGKAIKDKRGGDHNIHSWEFGLRGEVTQPEILLLNALLKERRKKHWAEKIGIDWMDGMPLTAKQISSFFSPDDLQEILDDLTNKGYLVYEHPKAKVMISSVDDLRTIYDRIPDTTKEKGYNIVTGKLSFEFSRILNPQEVTPTLVAMDMSTIGVVDNDGLRHLTLREGLRLLGYPETYSLLHFEGDKKGKEMGFDLLGNSVCVPVIKAVSERLLNDFY